MTRSKVSRYVDSILSSPYSRAVNAEAVRKAAQILTKRQAVTAYLIPGGAK